MDLEAAGRLALEVGWVKAAAKYHLTPDALRGRIRRAGRLPSKESPSPEKRSSEAPAASETRLVIPDCHVPAHDRAAWEILLAVAKDLRPDRAIIIGDFLDMASLSHHPKRQPDVIKFAEEVAAGNRALDELGDALPAGCRQTYLEGNHEGWSRSFEAENGALESVLAIDKHLRLAERGVDWVSLRRQDNFSLGPVAYLHGISESRHHAQTHADDFAPRVGKRHVVYGHLHTFQAATSRAGYSARCCGFLGDERNSAFGYRKGRPAPWVQGFLVQEVRGDCVTDTEVRITNGRAVFRGKAY